MKKRFGVVAVGGAVGTLLALGVGGAAHGADCPAQSDPRTYVNGTSGVYHDGDLTDGKGYVGADGESAAGKGYVEANGSADGGYVVAAGGDGTGYVVDGSGPAECGPPAP
jgi:hypothetical protein